ncbi:MAG: ABC transporter permease [Acidobacteriota bacterium]
MTSARRSLLGDPAFTAVAVATLALGVGATTAVFCLIDAVLLRPLPIPEADRVVRPTLVEDGRDSPLSPGLFLALRDGTHTLDGVAAIWPGNVTIAGAADAGGAPPQRVEGWRVSADYFDVLGIRAARGRVFDATEDRPGVDRVAVISEGLWHRRFDADPGLVGRSVRFDGEAHAVIGVMPGSLDLSAAGPQVWLPLALDGGQRDNVGSQYLESLARLAPGVEPETAAAELASLAEGLGMTSPRTGEPLGARAVPLAQQLTGDLKPRFWTLFGAVAAVLLIGCGNLAGLLLARGLGRRRELGVRMALGAGRGRLARQLLTESLVLGLLGAAAALPVARLVLDGLVAIAPAELPRLAQVSLNPRALGAAMALGVASSLVFGLLPAWRATRLEPRAALGGARTVADSGGRLRNLLVSAEVATAVVLLIAAGLLVRSLHGLAGTDLGFDPEGILSAHVALPAAEYPTMAGAVATYGRLVDETGSLPGVTSAALVSRVPFAGYSPGLDFALSGADPGEAVQCELRIAGPGFFETLGLPILAGRGIADGDAPDSEPSLVVNRALARRLGAGPGEEGALVGRVLESSAPAFATPEGEPVRWRIVGVAENVRERGLRRDAAPTLYFPATQSPQAPWEWMGRQMLLVARTEVPPETLVPQLRRRVAAVDPGLPIFDARSLEQRLVSSLRSERLSAFVLGAFGALGLALAAGGLYALVTYTVGQRRREIGIRMALGASPGEVMRMVTRQGLRPVVLGLAVGLVASVALTRLLASQLYGVRPDDPATFAAAAAGLLAVAYYACRLPAARASRVDPATVMDSE